MGFIALARSEVRRSLEPGDQGPVRGASQADAEGKADEEGLINSEGAIRLEGRMIGVVDGDTVVVEIDGREETVRLLGVDAPELNPGGLPEPFALEAKGFLERFIGEPVELIISVDEDERRDKLGRLLAVIICDGRNLNASLLERGLAVRLFQRNEALNFGAWEKLEVEARRERRGIWSGMGSKGIVITELNPNPGSVRDSVGEFVELMNLNPFPVNLGGWRLQRPGKSLELPEEAVIPAGGFLILCRTDPDTFRSIYPDVPPEVPVIRIKGLSLLNRYSPPEGMAIWLRDEVGWYQDGLSYNLRWDERGADGTDRTLEKLFPELMNVGDSRVGGEDDANWSPGLNPMGTPGRPNSLPKPPPGDASLNGVLTAYDAALALRNELGLERLYSAQLKAGDINGDGAFDARDALEILRRVVGLR
ncbi:hypothetical protein DRP77_04820 [Candidatus Poribacteria bacterium]|nr:MAG: hypothetical protein DRP77_04820 [Candidatus Poribacteria bacterium]